MDHNSNQKRQKHIFLLPRDKATWIIRIQDTELYDKELSGGRRSRKETIGGIATVKK